MGPSSTARRAEAQDRSEAARALAPAVGWVGRLPPWIDLPQLDGFAVVEIEARSPRREAARLNGDVRLLHVRREELGALPALRRAFPGARVVADLDSADEARPGRHELRLLSAADRIFVPSVWQLRELRRRRPALVTRTVVLREPVGPDAAEPASVNGDHVPTALFVGPLTPEGGLAVAVAAAARAAPRVPGLRLVALPLGVVGRRYLRRCRRQAASLRVPLEVVERRGAAVLAAWCSRADVVFLPYLDDAAERPALHAAAAARPVLGSEVAPLLEQVEDGVTGVLTAPGDVDTSAAVLETLLVDRDTAARLGLAARRKIERERSADAARARLCQLWTETQAR
jgi:glycosyltransferase involved in cell wall biosynthesis